MTTLSDVIAQLEHHGAVTLPGSTAGATERWLRRRRILLGTMLGVGAAGVLLLVLGILLREVGAWGLLIALGGLLAFVGLLAAGFAVLLGRAMSGRIRAERQAVVIDARGVALRGIGPLPWRFLAPAVGRYVRVRNDIGGDCTVMPLTPEGHRVVNAQAGSWKALVGPKPFLRTDIPYLLLPGVGGLTEDEVLRLFQHAHARFGGAGSAGRGE